ncbi:YqhR family membrane protein [Pseudalkalibacillus caeni]|uniref:YqhR n=1 Tax=Exobacillus caeni TaxID=2574798 RepID=A0A5R9F1N9_9BACL|nr:YqhR family membrane protein [Pseudalkalibacillus caeni]TLS36360.1 hypothetical protein FCL54_15635 [Pseudalkalibacillus caeni]
MEDNNRNMEQQQKEEPVSFNSKVVTIGLVGGLFWSMIGYLAYFLNFSTISPSLILSPWAIGEWKERALGQWVAIGVIGLVSILVAFLYRAALVKFSNMYVGMAYGILLWIIVFYILNPMFPKLPNPLELDRNTMVTTICLFILYGVFVGYSISFEYIDNQQNKSRGSSS